MRGLNILDALENLNTLVDADSLAEIEVTDDAHLIPHKGEEEVKENYWVQAGPDTQTLDAIKETFRSVHEYLESFYQKKKKSGDTRQVVEGINTIMVLVGEAAKKMDRFGSLFKERVTDFEEYRELQDFYRNHVIKESFKEFAQGAESGAGIEDELKALLQQESEEVEEVAGVHILNDLDVVKRDHLYELFYLKNEAGHRFYTPDLARTIKLGCDFGEFAEEYFGDDPLLQIKNWEDRGLHILAEHLLKSCRLQINAFYKEALRYKEVAVVALVHKALMALMLAANPRNLIRQFSLKGCHRYFNDFLLFLRGALHDREFQKFLVYSVPQGKPFFHNLYDLIHLLCDHLYTIGPNRQELKLALKHQIEKVEPKKGKTLAEALLHANHALTELLKKHPNGPIFKVLDIIREEEEMRLFDPLMQGNIPDRAWLLQKKGKQITFLRMPCPTIQAVINKAYIIEEFKAFLRVLDNKERLLMVNFQDRTSWKEHARAIAIEDIGHQAEFVDGLDVVTLAKDTDFYNQMGIYQEQNEAEEFIRHFEEHLSDESTGYAFATDIKKEIFPDFTNQLLGLIHKTFFSSRKELNFVERLDFIELAYHFIVLKLIEITNPTYIAFTSKDGLDMEGTSSVGLIALLAIAHHKKWSDEEIDELNMLLFGPTLMNRERVIHSERFERLYTMVRLLEEKKSNLKAFASLFKKETLEWEPTL